jgi:hypothetical protein
LCLRRSGLTLRSSGHTTAGHACSLCQQLRRRRVPLTSNVRPRVNRMRNLASTAVPHRTAAAEGSSLHRCVEQHGRCIGVGRPSAGGRRTAAARQGFFQRLRGLPLRRRAAHHRRGSNRSHRPNGRMCSQTVPSLKGRKQRPVARNQGLGSVAPRSCVSLLPRSAGASAHAVESRVMELAMVVAPSRVRSNPSVERTHNGGALWLVLPSSAAPLCAAHVKR